MYFERMYEEKKVIASQTAQNVRDGNKVLLLLMFHFTILFFMTLLCIVLIGSCYK